MGDVVLQIPAKVIYGPDVFHRAAEEISRHGTRVLVVTEAALDESELPQRLKRMLSDRGLQAIWYDDLPQGAGTATVSKIVSLAQAGHAQVVVGLGGMRVAAIARCAAAGVCQGDSLQRMLSGETKPQESLPYVEVATSYRNHWMLTDSVVITQQSRRGAKLFQLPQGAVRAVLFDPKIPQSLSSKHALATMMDMLLAACEGYLSSRSSFLSDTLFLRSIDTLKETMDATIRHPGEPGKRGRASDAGLMCAVGLSMSSQGPGAALTYAINCRFRVPKAWIAAALLPHILDLHSELKPAKVAKIARALGEDIPGISNVDDAAQASTVARRLLGKLGLPGRLQELDLTLNGLAEAAAAAAELPLPGFASTQDELFQIAKQAF